MSLRSQFRNISSQLLGNRSRYHLAVHLRRRPRMEMFLSRPIRAAAAFLAVVVCVSSAYSQERRGGERRGVPRGRLFTPPLWFCHPLYPPPHPPPHWVFGSGAPGAPRS